MATMVMSFNLCSSKYILSHRSSHPVKFRLYSDIIWNSNLLKIYIATPPAFVIQSLCTKFYPGIEIFVKGPSFRRVSDTQTISGASGKEVISSCNESNFLFKDRIDMKQIYITLSLFMLNIKQGSCEYQLLKSFG